MFNSRFQDRLFDEALSRFETLTKTIYKINDDRPYYTTQN